MKNYWDFYTGAYTAYRNLSKEELIKIDLAIEKKLYELRATRDSVQRLIERKIEEKRKE